MTPHVVLPPSSSPIPPCASCRHQRPPRVPRRLHPSDEWPVPGTVTDEQRMSRQSPHQFSPSDQPTHTFLHAKRLPMHLPSQITTIVIFHCPQVSMLRTRFPHYLSLPGNAPILLCSPSPLVRGPALDRQFCTAYTMAMPKLLLPQWHGSRTFGFDSDWLEALLLSLIIYR